MAISGLTQTALAAHVIFLDHHNCHRLQELMAFINTWPPLTHSWTVQKPIAHKKKTNF
jgi:hypothetical protein